MEIKTMTFMPAPAATGSLAATALGVQGSTLSAFSDRSTVRPLPTAHAVLPFPAYDVDFVVNVASGIRSWSPPV